MNCTNCQNRLPENVKFCPQCGQKVPSTKYSEPVKNEENATSLAKPVQAFALIFAAVTIAILIVFLILDSNKKDLEQKRDISTNTQDNPREIQVQLEKLAQDPESITLNIEMGNLLFDSGRFDEAIPFYQKALTMDSKNISVQIDLAVCFFNLRKTDQAILEMNKALKIDPNHPKGLFNMGIIYYNTGDFDKVREYWKRLISINPGLMESKRAQEILETM